jgi:hypothetical protein
VSEVDASVTVWAVDLVRAPKEDTRGTLSVGERAIEFRAAADVELTIPFAEVRKVRRLRGSPVLMVVHDREGVRERTAFFFVEPPPLEPPTNQPRPSLIPGSPRRRVRRHNVNYLGLGNRARRELVADWEARVRAAVSRASG